MILVIGGIYQGKTEYLKNLPEYGRLSEPELILTAYGESDSLECACKRPVILGFHHYVRRMADEAAVRDFITHIVDENPDVLITMDEVGYGIVPVEPEERRYRELVGLAGQQLAKHAEQVHRVVCGIGTRIK